MRWMHKGIFRAYTMEAHDVQATVKVCTACHTASPCRVELRPWLWHCG